jgi:predicted PurR-regulated permease PerM
MQYYVFMKTSLPLPPAVRAAVAGLLILLIILAMVYGKSLLIPLLLSAYISMLLVPLCNKLERWKFPRALSTFSALFIATVLLAGVFTFFFIQLSSFAQDLDNVQDRLDGLIQEFNVWTSSRLGVETDFGAALQKENLIETVKSNSRSITNSVLNTLGDASSVILLPVFIFLFLLYRDHLTKFVEQLFPEHDGVEIRSTLGELRRVIQKYIFGIIQVVAIVAVLSSIALLVIGVKHAIFFGVFAGLMNLIPYLGPFIAATLPIIFSLITKDSLLYPLAVLASFQIIQILESNLFTPKIVGSSVSLNPMITFIGILVGASLWGVIGMILIIPTMAILKKIFELSPATQPYAFLMGEEKQKKK